MSVAEAVQGIRSLLREDQSSTTRPDRISYSGDMWPRMQLWKKMGVIDRSPPDCVVWPESAEEVSAVLKAANQHQCPVVPYGAGSGVCGGTYPVKGASWSMFAAWTGFCASMRSHISWRPKRGFSGIIWSRLWRNRVLPLVTSSSILCSTLGGWVATRSAGQYSSLYGKIEDMVVGLEVVLPNGEILQTGLFGQNTGGDWTQIFVGSEGTLGIITRVLLRIHPSPTHREFRGFSFDRLSRATEAMRELMQKRRSTECSAPL